MAKLTDRIRKVVRDFWNDIPMSVFVALDKDGNPLEMKSAGREQVDYKSFVKQVARRHGRGDHIPDIQIQKYEFPNQWKVPQSGGDKNRYYRDKLLPAAEKQGVKAAGQIGLRDAVYTIKSGLPLFDATTEHGKLARRKDYKEFIAHNEQGRWQEFMQGKANKYTAVATDRGVMLFSQTTMGEKALHSYMQECARNFFDPARGTETLKLYEVTNPTAEVADMADNYIDKVSRRDQRSDDAGLHFSRCEATSDKMLDRSVLEGAVCTEKYDMRPDFHNLDRFTGENTLVVDQKNYDVAALLYIAENGYGNHLAADYFHPFGFEKEFQALADKLDDTMRAKGENPQSSHDFGYAALQKQAKEMARDILHTDFHIREGEFSLGQTRSNVIPLGRPMQGQQQGFSQQPEPKAAPLNSMKLPPLSPAKEGTTAQKAAPKRIPAMKHTPKGPAVS